MVYGAGGTRTKSMTQCLRLSEVAFDVAWSLEVEAGGSWTGFGKGSGDAGGGDSDISVVENADSWETFLLRKSKDVYGNIDQVTIQASSTASNSHL
jgi:hypothetical protein